MCFRAEGKSYAGQIKIYGDAAKRSEESYYPEGVVADDEKRNGTIYCNGSVVFSGSGSLQITGKKKHGISVKSSVTFRPGVTVVINDVDNNCVKADGITILGGTLKLYTSGNAIYEEDEKDTSSAAGIKADGNLFISDCDILCVSSGTGGKGFNVDGKITIESGKIDIATSGGKYVYNVAVIWQMSPRMSTASPIKTPNP